MRGSDYKGTNTVELINHPRPDCLSLGNHELDYGLEGDRILAEQMPEDLHVDLILGGHSHIDMDEAEVVNGIPIAQSSYGTTHVGRFDVTVDTERGGLHAWSWHRVALTEQTSEFDTGVDELADRVTFDKKNADHSMLCEFEKPFEHKSRFYEASLTGREIKDAFGYLFSLKPDGSVMSGSFLYGGGLRLVVDAQDCWQKGCTVESLTLNGEELEDERTYLVGMAKNCASSTVRYFSKPLEEERLKLLSLSTFHDLAKWCLDKKGMQQATRFFVARATNNPVLCCMATGSRTPLPA